MRFEGSPVTSAAAPRGQRKTVLMIDYYFPPLAGAGTQRTLGYVRYLSRFGWEPIVLTVRSGYSEYYDASQLGRIPESIDVQRTASLEPFRVAGWLLAGSHGEGNIHGDGSYRRMGRLRREIRRMRGLEYWLFFPDRYVGWAPFAVARALRINRRRAIDLVYSTSTAITSHVVAHIVKKVLGKPWVADFQDEWAEHPVLATRNFPSYLHASMARRLERLILRSSDHVIVTADPVRRTFEQRDGQALRGKVTVIPMGYDRAAFDHVRTVPRSKFTMTHFGSFYAARSPGPFLDALGQCVQEHPDLSEDLEVLFLGPFDPALRDLALTKICRWGLRDIVRLDGAVSHETGVSLVLSSDVLLIIGDPGEWHRRAVPAKLFEYLAARKPILALLPDGAAADILRAANAGMIVPPDDVRGIGIAIWDFYRRGKDGKLAFHTDQDMIERYAWHTLAGRLASVFDDALLKHASRRTKPIC